MTAEPGDQRRLDRRDTANRIDVLCDKFEHAWRSGDAPRIEDYLAQMPRGDRPNLLKELLSLELELLYRHRREAAMGDYLARFPDSQQLVRDVFDSKASGSPLMSLTSLAGILGQPPRATDDDLLAELHRLAAEKSFAAGEVLIQQGAPADSLIVVQQGAVEIRVTHDDGSTHTIDRAGPGQILGEMALLTSEPRTASAVAVEPVRAAVLPADAFHQLARRHPRLSSLLTDLIAARLGNTQRDALTDKRLDRYCIRRRLGRGGMSVVYEALDTADNTRVALKMMSHRLVNSEAALARFQLEADMIERFDHPHIVKMHRRFAAFRTYFIAMQYCQGDTLAHFLDAGGPLDAVSFRRAFGQLARALQYAHAAGVVHRDVKPANVMRLPDGGLKLMDFGLADPIENSRASEGAIVGTPRYMAPEQRVGDRVDQRADYFSLGCVAYEMLAGAPLFPRAAPAEAARDFRNWRPPDFTRLTSAPAKQDARLLERLLCVQPDQRGDDLEAFAAWAE